MTELEQHKNYMEETLRLAQQAKDNGCLPIGCIIVDENDNIIASVMNEKIITSKQDGNKNNKNQEQKIIQPDPTSHAEINAIRKACIIKNSTVLKGCTIYCSLEPCLMCISTIIISRISKVVFSVPDKFAGACGTLYNPIQDEYLNRKNIVIVPNIMKDEGDIIMKEYFEMVEKADDIDLCNNDFHVHVPKRILYKYKDEEFVNDNMFMV